ncbi:MAG: hypothetical protein ACAI38_13725 [Myxococcota bacterium]|nr:hypothetical protein [Myxococcota bacterium]
MKACKHLTFAAAMSAIAACGGFTDGGNGTKTLEVEARVSFVAGNANMNARVSVVQDGAQVPLADVTLRDEETEAIFTLAPEGNFYRASIAGGYRRKLELKIERGEDNLDAKLEGPGEHFVSSPFDRTTVELGDDPLTVNWTVSDGIRADDVAISLDGSDYRGETNRDQGEVEVPRELLRVGDDVIHVERSNSVDLDGGTGSSRFTMSYEATSSVTFAD